VAVLFFGLDIDNFLKRQGTLKMDKALLLEENKELRNLVRKLQEENKKLENMACTDILTGLGNKRGFDSVWSRSVEYAKRFKTEISVLFLDADYLKVINDNFGYDMGNKYLRGIAEIVQISVKRGIDFAARYGGDEFIIILPNTEYKGAEKITQEIKKEVSELREILNLNFATSVSIGIATKQNWDIGTPEDVIEEAQNKMKEDKGNKAR
jgi:diguanylate cyclase (GGDEF)-like protein